MGIIDVGAHGRAPAEARHILLLAWSGVAGIVLVLIGWMGLAGFLPPPDPGMSAAEFTELWQDDTNLKRLGLTLCVWGGTLYVPFSIAIALVLRTTSPALAWAQAALGTFGTVFFTLNFFILAMVPFRPSDEVSRTLSDLGFSMTFAPVAPFTFQYLLIALAIFHDTGGRPVFPRWMAYANLWVGVGLIPACMIPFFTYGPLAWNGLLSFWIPVFVFCSWYGVMLWGIRSALGIDERALVGAVR